MKCPHCGAEVDESDAFCGGCGKPLRREIEIAPKWKWGSMIASLVLVVAVWLLGVVDPIDDAILFIHIIWGVLAFPAIIYLMYKERTEKINYGLIWILLVVVLWILDGLIWDDMFVGILFNIPAFVIDVIYVYKTK